MDATLSPGVLRVAITEAAEKVVLLIDVVPGRGDLEAVGRPP